MTIRRGRVAAGAWAIFSFALWTSNLQPSFLVLAAIFAAGAVALSATFDQVRSATSVDWPDQDQFTPTQNSRDQRVTRLFRETYGSVWSDSTKLHNTLLELVDDRLLAHHGIDRHTSPDAARRLLPPSLQRLVDRDRTTARVRTLRQILTDIEDV